KVSSLGVQDAMRYPIFVVAVLGVVVACGSAPGPQPQDPSPTTLKNVTPSRNLHLRAAFDDNPSVYVGRFVPTEVEDAELDENRAAQTVCSKHFKTNEVGTNQEIDELVYASSQASAALGLAGAGAFTSAHGVQARGRVLRVHYKIT